MNQKELAEIRRRLKPDYNAIHKIYGCYVNNNKEIISTFDTSLGLMGEEELEMYFKLIKKAISGTLGKNLMDIDFTTSQVETSSEHQLLMKLKNSALEDEMAREEFFQKVIDSYMVEDTNYLILLAADRYDVTYKGTDDESSIDLGGGETFSYIICSICPVKAAKLQLKYDHDDGKFNPSSTGQIASSPEIGFMFPAFDDRSSNIYNALYYSHKPDDIHQELIDAVFGTEIPMTAGEQKVSFNAVMSSTLENDCIMEVVQAVHERLGERITMHKEAKLPEVLEVPVSDVEAILEESGLAKEKVEAFGEECRKHFGDDGMLNPGNIIDTKKFNVETSGAKISMSSELSYMVETRVIDGRRYILIPAEEEVIVNGIEIKIPLEEDKNEE